MWSMEGDFFVKNHILNKNCSKIVKNRCCTQMGANISFNFDFLKIYFKEINLDTEALAFDKFIVVSKFM